MTWFWLCLVADSPRTFRGAAADSVEARSRISGLDTLAWSKHSIATARGYLVQLWLMQVDDRKLKVKQRVRRVLAACRPATTDQRNAGSVPHNLSAGSLCNDF